MEKSLKRIMFLLAPLTLFALCSANQVRETYELRDEFLAARQESMWIKTGANNIILPVLYISHNTYPKLYTVIEDLSKQMNISMPFSFIRIHSVPERCIGTLSGHDSTLEEGSFAPFGWSKLSLLGIGSQQLKILNDTQVKAILADALAGIKHHQTIKQFAAGILIGIAQGIVSRPQFNYVSYTNPETGRSYVVITATGPNPLATLAGHLASSYLSRYFIKQRDKTASKITGNPDGLIQAINHTENRYNDKHFWWGNFNSFAHEQYNPLQLFYHCPDAKTREAYLTQFKSELEKEAIRA